MRVENTCSHEWIDKQLFHLGRLQTVQQQCRQIHGSLNQLYPIAVVENNVFYVFDVTEKNEPYQFMLEYPSPMRLPEKVFAAFPLYFYGNKASVVVSAGELANPDNDSILLHEFVHCFQWNQCEQRIKNGLRIEKLNKEADNSSWELVYPFPYDKDAFLSLTEQLEGIPPETGLSCYREYHANIKKWLSETDFEYMIWQEWKEGSARYIENLVRQKLGLQKNNQPLQPPFDRVCFYEIGSRYIEALIRADEALIGDIEKLYYTMAQGC